MPSNIRFGDSGPAVTLAARGSLDARARTVKRLAIAFVIAFTLWFGQPAGASDSPGELLKRRFDAAEASLAENNLSRAESQYDETIALGLRQLANLSIAEGQFDLAIGYLTDAQKLQPDDFQLQLGLAIAWFQRGDQEKASEVINAALASRPNDPQAHNLMGRIFLLQNDFLRAIQELRTALTLHYDFETAYFLGVAYLKVKKLPDAADLFDKLRSTVEES